MLNGDVLTDIDLTAELAQHERTGARATLALYPGRGHVELRGRADRRRRPGRGVHREGRRRARPTNRINAGAYVIEREVVESIPAGRAVSFEREVFPALVGNGLYGYAAAGYWIDIGTPERYLEATWDLLAGRVPSTLPPRDETGSLVYENCLARPARTWARRACSGATAPWARTRAWSARCCTSGCTWARTPPWSSPCWPRACAWASVRAIGPGAMIGAGAMIEADAVVARRTRESSRATVVAGRARRSP